MPTLKIPKETKLKNLPLETRLALRLAFLEAQRQKVGKVRELAKELGAEFMPTMMAVVALEKQGVIKIVPIDANQFEFQLEEENRKALQLTASNYNRHLKAQAERKVRAAKKSPGGHPPHLTPFTTEQRAPWMEKATVIATKIGAPRLAYKVANCLARIGEEEVNQILQSVLTDPDPKVEIDPNDKRLSPVSLFFKLYTARRNKLVQPMAIIPQ